MNRPNDVLTVSGPTGEVADDLRDVLPDVKLGLWPRERRGRIVKAHCTYQLTLHADLDRMAGVLAEKDSNDALALAKGLRSGMSPPVGTTRPLRGKRFRWLG